MNTWLLNVLRILVGIFNQHGYKHAILVFALLALVTQSVALNSATAHNTRQIEPPPMTDASPSTSPQVEAVLLTGQQIGNVSISDQSYPDGLAPFLVNKPFNETYQVPLWVNSFFDHKLPIYEAELATQIPSDLRDSNRSELVNFLGIKTLDDQLDCLGLPSCYSGHNGIDYNIGGREVVAPADGVIRVGSESGSCRVWIDHDASVPTDNTADFSTVYLHLASISNASFEAQQRPGRNGGPHWRKDDRIRAGEVIGVAGDDPCGGRSGGSHLHFGIASGSVNERTNHSIFDPFGWWSNTVDFWMDSRLNDLTSVFRHRPTRSLWAWAAPQNPGPENVGYWGDGIQAQTDDMDSSFQKFGYHLTGWPRWHAITPDLSNGINPIGNGAWWSSSILGEKDNKYKNWAVWGLHVPDNAQYLIQAHFPKLPQYASATSKAQYTIYVPTDDGTLSIWTSRAVDQRANGEWRDISDANGNVVFNLRKNTVVLVTLSDITGVDGEAVIFDAIRLKADPPIQQPSDAVKTGRVGFAIDNSSSMLEAGKLSAIKSILPKWVDELATSKTQFTYSLEPFANNTPAIQQTTSAAQIKAWINALFGNDNGVGNSECPEDSLGAIQKLAPFVKNGNMLLFTDDLPLSYVEKTISSFGTLLDNKVKLHVIRLPKSCNFGDNNPLGWASYLLLSKITGGTYQKVTADKTSEALEVVLNEMRAQAQLSTVNNKTTVLSNNAQSSSATGSSNAVHTFQVDSSVTKLNVLFNILEGAFTIQLTRPDGSPVAPNDPGVTFTDSGSAQYFEILNPAAGTWRASASGSGEYRFSASADTPLQFSYLGETRGTVNVPMELAARVSGPIASTVFVVEQPDGQALATVTLRDDGLLNDFVAGDGLYSGWFTPTQTGDFHLRISGETSSNYFYSRVDSRIIRVQGVRVIAPAAVLLDKGAEHELRFRVDNMEGSAQTYVLNATSVNGWIKPPVARSVTVPAGSSVDISIVVRVPSNAADNSSEKIWLSAMKQSDGTIIAEDMTMVFTDFQERSLPIFTIRLPVVLKDYDPSIPAAPTNTATATPTTTPTGSPTPTATQTQTPTPTNTPSPTPTPTNTPTTTPTPTNTPSPTPTPTPTSTPISPSGQWQAEFWNNETLSGSPVLTRLEPAINYYWYDSSPSPLINSDHFSIRFSGTINAPQSGILRFYVYHDDGARLWVDGTLQIEEWHRNYSTHVVEVPVNFGLHNVVLEYFEQVGGASLSLSTEFQPGECNSAIHSVLLYEHPNYQGRCINFWNDHIDFNNLSGFNDLASSVYFGGAYTNQYEVSLYEHAYYQGNATILTSTLSDFAPSGWDNRASSLRIRPLVDGLEPDDSCAQAVFRDTFNAFDRHTFHAGDASDWLYFNPNPGTTYVIRTQDLGPLADTVLTLLRSDCTTVIASNDDGGGGRSSLITWTADTSNPTYVRISSFNGATGPGRFYDSQITYVGYPSTLATDRNSASQPSTSITSYTLQSTTPVPSPQPMIQNKEAVP